MTRTDSRSARESVRACTSRAMLSSMRRDCSVSDREFSAELLISLTLAEGSGIETPDQAARTCMKALAAAGFSLVKQESDSGLRERVASRIHWAIGGWIMGPWEQVTHEGQRNIVYRAADAAIAAGVKDGEQLTAEEALTAAEAVKGARSILDRRRLNYSIAERTLDALEAKLRRMTSG